MGYQLLALNKHSEQDTFGAGYLHHEKEYLHSKVLANCGVHYISRRIKTKQ